MECVESWELRVDWDCWCHVFCFVRLLSSPRVIWYDSTLSLKVLRETTNKQKTKTDLWFHAQDRVEFIQWMKNEGINGSLEYQRTHWKRNGNIPMPLVVHDQNICNVLRVLHKPTWRMTTKKMKPRSRKEKRTNTAGSNLSRNWCVLVSYRIERTNDVLYCNYSSRSLLRVPV